MSYTFLLEQGEESSAGCFSDIPASVLSRLTLIDESLCYNASETESCPSSQSGTMLKPSMASRGEEGSMSYVADSLARTSAQQERAPELKARKADSGKNTPEYLAKFDLVTHSWKTRQISLAGVSEPFLETWPYWGTMRNGALYPQPTPYGLLAIRASITCAIGSGYSRLQTPVADDSVNRERGKFNSRGEPKLSAQLRMQTPTVQDAHGRDRHNQKNGSVILSLLGECRRLPTAVSVSSTGGRAGLDGGSHAREAMTETERKELTGGNLNPEWIEWFMGWPMGWTALQPLETARFQSWLLLHGKP